MCLSVCNHTCLCMHVCIGFCMGASNTIISWPVHVRRDSSQRHQCLHCHAKWQRHLLRPSEQLSHCCWAQMPCSHQHQHTHRAGRTPCPPSGPQSRRPAAHHSEVHSCRRWTEVWVHLLLFAVSSKIKHYLISCDIMWLRHMSFTHVKKVSGNVKACKEDIKRPAPEGECPQVSDGEACSAAGTVIQTHSQLLIWVGTTEYKSTIATRQRETEQASTLTGSSGNTFVPDIRMSTHLSHSCTLGNSPRAHTSQLYDESTWGTPLKHVYKHGWGIAIITKTLDNKCAVSFCIQCTRYSMLKVWECSYLTTLCCKEKYSMIVKQYRLTSCVGSMQEGSDQASWRKHAIEPSTTYTSSSMAFWVSDSSVYIYIYLV